MRADAETAGPAIHDDAPFATTANQLANVALRRQRDDAGSISLRPAAKDRQSRPRGLLAQIVRYFHYPPGDVWNADLQQHFQARPESDNAGHVERPALPAARVRLQTKIDAREIAAADHAVPAD